MNFKPVSEQDIEKQDREARGILDHGVYDFTVIQAENCLSKKDGSPQIKVKLGIYVGEKIGPHIYCYLTPKFAKIINHFCFATGLEAKYQAGSLDAADCKGRSGKVRLKITPTKGEYPEKNEVEDFIKKFTPSKPTTKTADGFDTGVPQSSTTTDDIPF